MIQKYIRCLDSGEWWDINGFKKLYAHAVIDEAIDPTEDTFEIFYMNCTDKNGACDVITIEVNGSTVFSILTEEYNATDDCYEEAWVDVALEEMLQGWANGAPVKVKNKSELIPHSYYTVTFNDYD